MKKLSIILTLLLALFVPRAANAQAMKKLLVTLIVSLVFSGSIFAHLETHWPGFEDSAFESYGSLYASLMIDGEPVTSNTENWDQMEVAAFVGDELRMTGMFLTDDYVVEYGEPFPSIDEPIYYTTPGEVVSFKMYNHATGDLYEVCESFIYQGDPITILTGEEHLEGYDDPDHPLMLNFISSTATACTYALAGGENWLSFYNNPSLSDLKNALEMAFPSDNDIVINSQSGGWAVLNNGQWRGPLNTLDATQMYMINIPAESYCEIELAGTPVDLSEHSVTISNGYNWIGYPLTNNMNPADAFAGFAVNGDQIISKTANAEYKRSRWIGRFNNLEPGKGYIYNSAATEDRILVFPADGGANGSRANRFRVGRHWSDFNYHQYEFNQPLVATIQIDGEFIGSEDNWSDYEVAAFVNGECRGTAFLENRYVEDFNDPYTVIEMPVYYTNSGEEVTFKMYDHATGTEYELSDASSIVTGVSQVLYFNEENEPGLSLNFILTPVDIDLANNAANNSAIITANAGKPANVTLTDRTLYKDGAWNTLCLPFNVTLAGSPLEGATARTLTNAEITESGSDKHISLTFGNPVEQLAAGVPYIIKWAADGSDDIKNPVFTGVTISSTELQPRSFLEGQVQFKGNYNAFTVDDANIYYMSTGDETYEGILVKAASTRTMLTCRAYFQFSDAEAARSIILNFGEGEASGIVEQRSENTTADDRWYTVDGVKLDKQPARKGLYIQGGRKVVVK